MIEFLNQLVEVAKQIWPILIIMGLIVLTFLLPDKKSPGNFAKYHGEKCKQK